MSPTAVNSGTPLDQKPVGAGPFVLDSYTPEGKAVFKKNPNYFEKDKIKLKGVELIQTSNGSRPAGARSTRCSTASPTPRSWMG